MSIRDNPSLEFHDKNKHLDYVLEKLKVLNNKETDDGIKKMLIDSINLISPKIRKKGLKRF